MERLQLPNADDFWLTPKKRAFLPKSSPHPRTLRRRFVGFLASTICSETFPNGVKTFSIYGSMRNRKPLSRTPYVPLEAISLTTPMQSSWGKFSVAETMIPGVVTDDADNGGMTCTTPPEPDCHPGRRVVQHADWRASSSVRWRT